MRIHRFFRFATLVFVCAVAVWVTSSAASAQMPTPSGADGSVGSSPATAANATLPVDNSSPLKLYLFMFILVGGGLIGALAVRLTDKGIKGDEFRWNADGSRRVLGLPVI